MVRLIETHETLGMLRMHKQLVGVFDFDDVALYTKEMAEVEVSRETLVGVGHRISLDFHKGT